MVCNRMVMLRSQGCRQGAEAVRGEGGGVRDGKDVEAVEDGLPGDDAGQDQDFAWRTGGP